MAQRNHLLARLPYKAHCPENLANCCRWLLLVIQTASKWQKQHYISILPFNPPNWEMCHQSGTLKDVVVLLEAYAFGEPGAYLILQAWKICNSQERTWVAWGLRTIVGQRKCLAQGKWDGQTSKGSCKKSSNPGMPPPPLKMLGKAGCNLAVSSPMLQK